MARAKKKIPATTLDTFNFCVSRRNRYIGETVRLSTFMKSAARSLSFHKARLTQDRLDIEIEEFSLLLANYLMALGFKREKGATRAIRDAVRNPRERMSTLLNALKDNFKS